MEKGEAAYSDTPAVFVTGCQIASDGAVVRACFVERVADNAPLVERCAIVMSLETAKSLRDVLDAHIIRWGK